MILLAAPGGLLRATRLPVFAILICCLVSGFLAHAAGVVPPPGSGIAVMACSVYSERDHSDSHDCTSAARAQCDGQPNCELPIGLSLSGGKDIDEDSEKKVKIRYRCGEQERMQGPHYQNDHAAMILRC